VFFHPQGPSQRGLYFHRRAKREERHFRRCDRDLQPRTLVLRFDATRLWPLAATRGDSPLKCRDCCQRGHPNYFRNRVPQFLPPTDRASSCARGSAIPCRPERTSLAIAGVRRLLPCPRRCDVVGMLSTNGERDERIHLRHCDDDCHSCAWTVIRFNGFRQQARGQTPSKMEATLAGHAMDASVA
jgi:hypothetical protein